MHPAVDRPRRARPSPSRRRPSTAASVYVGSTNGVLSAFDAAGSTGCSGSPMVCTPLWTATTGGPIVASPAVANNVVYVGSSDHELYAFDGLRPDQLQRLTEDLHAPVDRHHRRRDPLVARGGQRHGVRGLRRSPALRLRRHRHDRLLGHARGLHRRCGRPPPARRWPRRRRWPTAVVYVGSLDDQLYAYKPWVFTRPVCPTNPHAGLSPCQLQDAYELPSQVTGAGRTVAIVDAFDDPNAESDLAIYRAGYGLPACTTANGCFAKLNQSGVAGSYPTANASWSEEISLDLDTVSAICPTCHIVLVEAKSTSLANLAVAEGVGRRPLTDRHLQQLGQRRVQPARASFDSSFSHAGIVTTFSTGDSGYGTSYPSSSPCGGGGRWHPAVHRHQHPGVDRDGLERRPERLLEPGAQAGLADRRGCTNRTTADVSALAGSPGESIYDSYGGDTGWEDFGGTSLAVAHHRQRLRPGLSRLADRHHLRRPGFAVRRDLRARTGRAAAPTCATRASATTARPAWAPRAGPRPSAPGPFATTSCPTTVPPSAVEAGRGASPPRGGVHPVVWHRCPQATSAATPRRSRRPRILSPRSRTGTDRCGARAAPSRRNRSGGSASG